jgi:hypothetical protein
MADDMPIDLTFLIFLAEWVLEILNSLQNGTRGADGGTIEDSGSNRR